MWIWRHKKVSSQAFSVQIAMHAEAPNGTRFIRRESDNFKVGR